MYTCDEGNFALKLQSVIRCFMSKNTKIIWGCFDFWLPIKAVAQIPVNAIALHHVWVRLLCGIICQRHLLLCRQTMSENTVTMWRFLQMRAGFLFLLFLLTSHSQVCVWHFYEEKAAPKTRDFPQKQGVLYLWIPFTWAQLCTCCCGVQSEQCSFQRLAGAPSLAHAHITTTHQGCNS